MVELQGSTDLIDPAAAQTLAARLRRRFRKALIAYARAALRTKSPKGRLIDKARRAALDEIGARGAMLAERLADIEASAAPATSVIRLGVNRPLMDLALDWQRRDPA
jgi:hypothetical protein